MSRFEDIKGVLVSKKDNINKDNFIAYVNYLKENYFKAETGESNFEKLKHSMELLNTLFRFVGPWKTRGFLHSKQLFLPENIEEIKAKFIVSNNGLFSLLGFKWEEKHPIREEILPQLVELGLYKDRLREYETEEIENICQTIIKRSSEGPYKSYYLSISKYKEDNKSIFLESKTFNEYKNEAFSKTGNIEEIKNEFIVSNKSLFNLLGFKWERQNPTIEEILPQLVELGLYKDRLREYETEKRENICQTIINRTSESNYKSYYLSISKYKEDNKSIFLGSKTFNEFKNEAFSKIGNIEEIKAEFIRKNKSLFNLLEFTWKREDPNMEEILPQLVELGLYKDRLNEYETEKRENICQTIINRTSEGSYKSYYLSISKYKEDNKSIFLGSKTFNEYKNEASSKTGNIEEIKNEFIEPNKSLFNLLEFTWEGRHPNMEEILPQLVELGLYKDRLNEYETEKRENICQTIIKRNSEGGGYKSYYLSISKYKEDNKSIFLGSKTFKKVFSKIGNIEEINKKFIVSNIGLFSLLGFKWEGKNPNMEEILPQLVELGLYKDRLREYETEKIENICQTIIKRSSEGPYKSYYLSISKYKEENKDIFSLSETFKKFLREASPTEVKRLFKKYGLFEPFLEQETKFSILNSPWSDEDVNRLISLYDKYLDELKLMIRSKPEISQEFFGRSPDAVLTKLYSLIYEKPDSLPRGYVIDSRGISSYPKKVEDLFHEIYNYSLMHSRPKILDEFPVISYYYPYKHPVTEDTCYVFLVPIMFRGHDLDKYKPFEQFIISRLFSKLININSNELIPPERILEMKKSEKFHLLPSISKDPSLVGLYVRKRFSLNEKMGTFEFPEEIELKDGRKKNFNYWIVYED